MNYRDYQPVNTGIRLAAMLLDQFFMTMVVMVFLIPSIIADFASGLQVTHEPTGPGFMGRPTLYLMIFGISLYLCKDVINGRSLAKRILKLQVVDHTTGRVASPLQCFIRNIFCIIWPVEVIVALVNPERRLGDRVAGTRLVCFNPALEQPRLNLGRVVLPMVLSYVLVFFISLLLPGREGATQSPYVESSYNAADSKALEQLFDAQMGDLLVPDIRVYDSIENKRLKYLSIILKMKQNYLADEVSYSRVHNTAVDLVHLKFQKEPFMGILKYFYRNTGQFQSRSTTIGRALQRGKG